MAFNFILSEDNTTVDMSMLQELVGDDISIIKPIIDIFLDNMPATIENLNRFYELKDWDSLYKSAHYIKSSVSVIRVDEIYNAATDIEFKAKNLNELDSIGPNILIIEQHFRNAKQLIEKELQKL
jgi:HPt (histidine-containing phosphotransfer) domain-containing protein